MPVSKRSRLILRAATLVVAALVLVVIAGALRRDGPAALEAWRASHVRWGWVALATACALVSPAASALGWRRLLADLGLPVSFGWVLRLFLASNIGRYMPGGKAWQLGLVAVMSTERGLPAALVTGTSFLHGLVGVVVGAILILPLGGALVGGAGPLFALSVAGIVGLLALPLILRRLPRVRAQVAKHVPGIDAVDSATLWAVVWTSAAAWLAWGGVLYSLAWALLPSPGAPFTLYAAAWIASFLAGILAFFSPAGLGAREGAMQAILVAAGVVPSAALLLAIVVRVFATLMEVVPGAILLLVYRQKR